MGVETLTARLKSDEAAAILAAPASGKAQRTWNQ
jgi:hypothetical protein